MRKHLRLAVLCAAMALPMAGCSHLSQDQRTQLIEAAQSLTDAAFVAGAPVLSEAVQALPAEAQLLVQAGYGALRKAVEVAESAGIDHLGAKAAVVAVADTADSLSSAVHAAPVNAVTTP